MNINSPFYIHTNASVSAVWHYATGVYSLLCLLCGTLSNGLVILVFIRNTVLQQPKNFLLINLALTDLGLILTNTSLHSIASFNKNWPFGQQGCSFYGFCGGVCGLTSIATMAAIALTRLAVVIDPFSSLRLTERFALKCIICSWIYGLIWMIPPLFGWNRFVLEGFGTTCTFDYISKDFWNRLYIITIVIGGFLIPLIIIVVSYTIILHKLSKRSHHLIDQNVYKQSFPIHLEQQNSYYFISNSPNYETYRNRTKTFFESNETTRMTQIIRLTEARATRTALLVLFIYCTAWGPYAFMTILSQTGFEHYVNMYTTAVLGLFTKTAACINPLVYALSSSGFRRYICIYSNFFYKCYLRSYPISSPTYDFNRRNLTITITARPTASVWSQQ
ncbi:unnamed protein product [Adineta steineri]|uniref:G-protein coupled receptors family 1 profile domain-containing protein n=1 Tax=Adineta steineri TaxID=433720 RepID=A0A814PTH5_9BILA|nr:unnamed protein product [Adineta steineri]